MNLPMISGVYELTQSEQVSADLELDFTSFPVVDKSSILQPLSDTFHFPDYFGHNWDAAFDCLLDALEKYENVDVLVRLPASTQCDEEALIMLRQLMQDVVALQPVDKRVRFLFLSVAVS